MPLHLIFRKLRTVGQITIGTGLERNGQMTYIAACGAHNCGWSSDYATYAAAEIAARGHRCPVR
ncbi:mobile element transfer protein [Streptomyces lasiicapitis]|uniref:mobile element transfer protein n=1 Tax=Streptomyces lasiicapitis TaxID=1923961 RepID=UPI0036848E3F